MKTTGIYKIENTRNGCFYIGSTVKNISDRWSEHRSALRSGKHRNHLLQADWNKYGEISFRFIVLEVLPVESVLLREQELIDQLFDNGVKCYNLANRAIAGGGRTSGSATLSHCKQTHTKKQQVNVDFSRHPELYFALIATAKEQGVSISRFIRDLIWEAWNKHTRAGIASGCVTYRKRYFSQRLDK